MTTTSPRWRALLFIGYVLTAVAPAFAQGTDASPDRAIAAVKPALVRIIVAEANYAEGRESKLARAIGDDMKGKISLAGYAAAIPLAFFREWLSDVLYVAIALLWLVPDKRIESSVRE